MSRLEIKNGAEAAAAIYFDQLSDSVVIEGQNGKKITIKSDAASSWAPPVGAAYVQFPGLPDPGSLWSGTTWQKKFADEGVFFRTEGGYALPFEEGIQEHALEDHYHQYLRATADFAAAEDVNAAALSWSNTNGTYGANVDPNETRPRNRTIRVWERIS